MKRVLILGGTGMLGHKLVQVLSGNFDVWSAIRGTFEPLTKYGFFTPDRTITDIHADREEDVRRAIEMARPDVLVNCIGVVKQLPSANDVITTLTINSILPHRLYQLSAEYRFRLILISTDCVFNGEKGMYVEDDPSDAVDLYGRSKNLGEVIGENCLTIRTSIIGRELTDTHSLVEWFLKNKGVAVKGFVKAVFSGFPTIVFADIIADLLSKHPELDGLFHVSSDPIDKFRLLSLVNEYFAAGVTIEPSDELVIDRSLDSTRFRAATGFTPQPWEAMIERMAADPTPYDEWRK